jgi:hypothetical protein
MVFFGAWRGRIVLDWHDGDANLNETRLSDWPDVKRGQRDQISGLRILPLLAGFTRTPPIR